MIKHNKRKSKIIILLVILLLFYSIKKDLLIKLLSNIELSSINDFRLYINQYSNMKPFDPQVSIFHEFKKKIYKLVMRNNVNRRIRNVKSLYIDVNFRFGNLIVFLNKILFYCEIIGCEYIILNKDKFWFLNDTINIKYKNITIKKGNHEYFKSSSVLYNKPWKIYSNNFFNIKTPIRVHLLRDQIINNLPKIITKRDELYIHVRSGNVFNNYFHSKYAQPPFCFYFNILKNFKFEKVILIAKDSYNPIIKKLIQKFPKIKFAQNSIKEDISILMNAFNIVCSISSLLITILQLNYQFEFLWDYNIYQIDEKMKHFHFDFNKLPHNNFTLFRMEPSLIYKNKMLNWKHTKAQLKLMLKEKCINEFTIIKKEN